MLQWDFAGLGSPVNAFCLGKEMTPQLTKKAGTLTVIGSGELSPSMGKAYRAILARIAESVNAVFLDTPAGFELNVDHIAEKAVAYFKLRLQMQLRPVSFKSALAAEPHDVKKIVNQLRAANFILAGPGSPTYTVRNLRDTAVWDAISCRLSEGAHLVVASAAAIAVGRYSLPVYEIYKVGDSLHWTEGLDLLGPYGLDLAIVPHWNNAEGGTHDTRYCFMGGSRLVALEQLLPATTTVLGVDEYTACIMDLENGSGQVMGAGKVTVRRRGSEVAFPAGAVFNLDQLCDDQWQGWSDVASELDVAPLPTQIDANSPIAMSEGADNSINPLAVVSPFVDLLVALRTQLREEEQWALADEIRQQLLGLGIVLQDGPDQTTWRLD